MGYIGVGGLKKEKGNTGVTQTIIAESINHPEGWGIREELGVNLGSKPLEGVWPGCC